MKNKTAYIWGAIFFILISIFLFICGVVALVGQESTFLFSVARTLWGLFSVGIFLLALCCVLAGFSLVTRNFSKKEGLVIAGLFVLSTLLFSLLVGLLGGSEAGMHSQIREAIIANYGFSIFTIYLCGLLLCFLCSCMAPVKLLLLSIDLNAFTKAKDSPVSIFQKQNGGGVREKRVRGKRVNEGVNAVSDVPDVPDDVDSSEKENSPISQTSAILDAFPNVKRLYETAKKEEIKAREMQEELSPHFDEPVVEEAVEEWDDFCETPAPTRVIAGLGEVPNVQTVGELDEFLRQQASLEEVPVEEEEVLESYDLGAFNLEEEDPGIQFLEESYEEEEEEEVVAEFYAVDETDEVDVYVETEIDGFDNDVEIDVVADQGEGEEVAGVDVEKLLSINPTAVAVNIFPATLAPAVSKSEKKPAAQPVKKENPAIIMPKPYGIPVESTLKEHVNASSWQVDDETRHSAQVLQQTLEEFNIQAEVTGIRKGPVITMFEILPAPGVKLSKIVNLSDNIALRLAASRVRIVAPIPGKHAVGIEIPNKKRSLVGFREMVEDEKFKAEGLQIPVILGKDITGNAQIIDLAQTPHLLIAGATGSGKSVCVNSLITSLLFSRRPDEVRLLLIDPKIVELKLYNDVPHLLTEVITDPKRAFQALQYCLSEMERRYSLLDSVGCRDIRSFNTKIKVKKLATEKLPYIVVIVDEFADLMATTGKELESTLARLAAMSRAVGIHLVLATQRPSIDVITGIIKANIPSRIAFMVASKFDSRIIIDAVGAEKLLGKGDMLFSPAWDPIPMRIQGAYLSDEEVENVVAHVKTLGPPDYIDDEIFIEEEDGNLSLFAGGGDDPLANRALEIVIETGKVSASYLQRRLKIGYNRAARLVEDMEARGIVGPPNGSKPREVLSVPSRFEDDSY